VEKSAQAKSRDFCRAYLKIFFITVTAYGHTSIKSFVKGFNSMDSNNVNVAQLSSDEVQILKDFEKEFASKHGKQVILIACR
jgi:hypothetical protein